MNNSNNNEVSRLKKEIGELRVYLDVADAIIIAIAPDQSVTYINEKGCDLLGYSREEVLGKPWFDTFLPKRSGKQTKKVFEDLIAGRVKPAEYFENPILTKSGEERLISWHNKILRDKSGRTISTISSGEDITERRKVEDALKKVLKKLQVDMRETGRGADPGEVIRTRRITLWRIKGSEYADGVMRLAKVLSGMYDKVVYISINRPLKSVLEDFSENHINRSKFRFVCVGSGELPMSKGGDCVEYVETRDMTSLGIKVGEVINKARPKALILDSFNTMSVYMDDNVVTRFAQDLIIKLEAIGCKGVFPVIATERETPLMNNLEMLMDEVVDLS
jgi:PAS domain S-box-containing protein